MGHGDLLVTQNTAIVNQLPPPSPTRSVRRASGSDQTPLWSRNFHMIAQSALRSCASAVTRALLAAGVPALVPQRNAATNDTTATRTFVDEKGAIRSSSILANRVERRDLDALAAAQATGNRGAPETLSSPPCGGASVDEGGDGHAGANSARSGDASSSRMGSKGGRLGRRWLLDRLNRLGTPSLHRRCSANLPNRSIHGEPGDQGRARPSAWDGNVRWHVATACWRLISR